MHKNISIKFSGGDAEIRDDGDGVITISAPEITVDPEPIDKQPENAEKEKIVQIYELMADMAISYLEIYKENEALPKKELLDVISMVVQIHRLLFPSVGLASIFEDSVPDETRRGD